MTDDVEPTEQAAAKAKVREDRIRMAAYRRFLNRHYLNRGPAGDPVTDWLEAEAEVDGEDAN